MTKGLVVAALLILQLVSDALAGDFRGIIVTEEQYVKASTMDLKLKKHTDEITSHLRDDRRFQDLTQRFDANKAEIKAAIRVLAQQAKPGDTSYFLYFGHGNEGGLLLVDGAGYSPAELKADLDQVAGKKILVLASCFSGLFATNVFPILNYSVLSVAQSDEMSTTDSIYAFLQGIGGRDETDTYFADSNRNGEITMAELYQWMSRSSKTSQPILHASNDPTPFLRYNKRGAVYPAISSVRVLPSPRFSNELTVQVSLNPQFSRNVAKMQLGYVGTTGYPLPVTMINLGENSLAYQVSLDKNSLTNHKLHSQTNTVYLEFFVAHSGTQMAYREWVEKIDLATFSSLAKTAPNYQASQVYQPLPLPRTYKPVETYQPTRVYQPPQRVYQPPQPVYEPRRTYQPASNQPTRVYLPRETHQPQQYYRPSQNQPPLRYYKR